MSRMPITRVPEKEAAAIIADALISRDDETVADALYSISHALQFLGNGNAASSMGAIEGLAMQVRDGSQAIASAISDLAQAIRETRE